LLDGTLNDPSDTDKGWSVEIAWPWEGLKELTRCRRKTAINGGSISRA
jgi:hypothetical protein